MDAIKKLLEKNPDLLKFNSLSSGKKEKKKRYEHVIEDDFDKLEDIADEVQSMVMDMPHWRMEIGEKVFEFGKAIAEEYRLNLGEVDRLFNDVLPKRTRGPLSGFFISGAYHEIIREEDRLSLDLSRYPGAISGLGFRHPRGRLELAGNRSFYLGGKMTGGEILLRGNAANHVGKYLQGGRIVIEGNVRNWVGQQMHGGLLIVNGNAGEIIGKDMTGGEIIIEGDAGGWVGDGMKDGIIRIKGDCGPLDESIRTGGEIFGWQEGEWVEVE